MARRIQVQEPDPELGVCMNAVGINKENKDCILGCGGVLALAFSVFLIVLFSSIKVVEVNQQLLFSNSRGKWVRNGPFTAVIWPHQRMERREAIRLGSREFVVLKNERTGERRHVSGPGLIFPEAYDSVEETRPKVMLQKNEYMRLVDTLSGFERVVKGPQTLVPEPLEEAKEGKEQAVIVGASPRPKFMSNERCRAGRLLGASKFDPLPRVGVATADFPRARTFWRTSA